ncbi:DNA primase [Sphingomonas sp. FW199]|uniref:DNA primase n=1 Tax=Sphingomonas sp. FW199 TaxID=3400217 RepID=UPI003CF5C0F5
MMIDLGPNDDGYDEDGYDESQRAEILEVEGGGPGDGVIQNDMNPDLGQDPDAVQDEEEDDLSILGEDEDEDEDDEDEDELGDIVPLDGERDEQDFDSDNDDDR